MLTIEDCLCTFLSVILIFWYFADQNIWTCFSFLVMYDWVGKLCWVLIWIFICWIKLTSWQKKILPYSRQDFLHRSVKYTFNPLPKPESPLAGLRVMKLYITWTTNVIWTWNFLTVIDINIQSRMQPFLSIKCID